MRCNTSQCVSRKQASISGSFYNTIRCLSGDIKTKFWCFQLQQSQLAEVVEIIVFVLLLSQLSFSEIVRKSYSLYQLTPLLMTLSDVQGHLDVF